MRFFKIASAVIALAASLLAVTLGLCWSAIQSECER